MKYSLVLSIMLAGALWSGAADAQNAISQDGWEGFAVRDADNKFDRCILYNRTIPALNASPYEMIGLSRDATERIGLLVFFTPRSLTRGDVTLGIKFDQRPVIKVPAEALSDFHAVIHALGPAAVAELRQAKTLEATADGKTVQADLTPIAAVLDRLEACVKTYGPNG